MPDEEENTNLIDDMATAANERVGGIMARRT